MHTARTGFFGKLPARGDFVGAGLPASFVEPWAAWAEAALVASRATLGGTWLAAWMEAPVWRFHLPASACGPLPALGLFLPSVDRVGRCFPLLLATLTDAVDPAWLDAAERAGRAAIADDLDPEALAALIPASAPNGTPSPHGWWTVGGPRVLPGRHDHPGLPPVGAFAGMLDRVAPGLGP